MTGDVHGDVGNASLILVVDVVEAEAAIDSQVLIDLVGGTKLESEDVLLTVNVALYGVARRVASQSEVDAILLLVGGVGQLQDGGQQGHLALEGSETAVEGTLTATAHQAEGKLKSPLVVVQGCLYRRYERGRSFTLEMLDAVGVASVEAQRMGVWRLHPLFVGHGKTSRFEERHAATDGTRL